MSVDQMCGDFLNEFKPAFSHGLTELDANGTSFDLAVHTHSCTNTAVGHATIATGCFPRHHGISGNSIFNRQLQHLEYAVYDSTALFEGIDSCSLKTVSPKNLERQSYGDLIKAADPKSKSYSVSLKDRTSILMGGKHADRSFWFDSKSTQMVSTKSYNAPFPAWVKQFKAGDVMAKEIEKGWHFEVPKSAVTSYTRQDTNIYEEAAFSSYFPHTIANLDSAYAGNKRKGNFLWNTPYGDKFLLEFAKQLISSEGLGQDDHVDALSIGLSASDYIGHHFGPKSMEVLDYYFKFDKYLGDFISFLDSTVGKENYVLVLTSDHGVCPIPENMAESDSISRISSAQFKSDLENVALATQDELNLNGYPIVDYKYNGIEPNFKALEGTDVDSLQLVEHLCAGLEKLDYIVTTFNGFELESADGPKDYHLSFYHNYHRNNSLFIEILGRPYTLINKSKGGTSHGTPYNYDSQVPIVFYGGRFSGSHVSYEVTTVDIAPSILFLLGISADSLDGQAIVQDYWR